MNQTKFIEDLIANVRAEIIMKSKNFPKEWENTELRQYVSDCFQNKTYRMAASVRKNYKNEVIVRNL